MTDTLSPSRNLVDVTGAEEPDFITIEELTAALPRLRGDGRMRWTTDAASVEHDNTYRMTRAADALLVYAGKHDNAAELRPVFEDMLTDLMHLAHAAGQPWWSLLDTARGNYEEELRGV